MQDAAAAPVSTDFAKTALLGALAVVALAYIVAYVRAVTRARASGAVAPTPIGLAIGFVTNFFDTLGIGSFAPTTAAFRMLRTVPDEKIPGTLNVGHALATVIQTVIFTKIVPVESTTLIAMIAAASVGAWLGAGIVSGLNKRSIQLGMGVALLVASGFLLSSLLGLTPEGGTAVGVSGGLLLAAVGANFVLGALMTLGIGLYAPCMIVVSLLGMNVSAAFPIMMGSCAFLMPVASTKFFRTGGFDVKAALGLTLGSIPGVLIAAYIVKTLPLTVLRWVVLVVILYTGATLLWAARRRSGGT